MKSRRMRWARHLAGMREKKNALSYYSEGKTLLRRLRRRWMDNIQKDLGEIRWLLLTGFVWFRIITSGG
jgi:hypothetical protein